MLSQVFLRGGGVRMAENPSASGIFESAPIVGSGWGGRGGGADKLCTVELFAALSSLVVGGGGNVGSNLLTVITAILSSSSSGLYSYNFLTGQ